MSLFSETLPVPQMPIFDVHMHIGASDSGEIYYPHFAGEEYVEIMRGSAIEVACAFAPLHNAGYATANRQLADWCETTGGRVLPFARLGGRQPLTEPRLWMLRRQLRELVFQRPPDADDLESLERFVGVKLLPHLDGVPDEDVFQRINELELPVLIHGGVFSSPVWIERHILARMQTPLIIAHLGSFPCDEGLLKQAVDLAQREERVYLDTSGVWTANFLQFALSNVPHKLLFGSDAPLTHPLVAWQHLASIVKDTNLLQQISYQRAADLFAIAERGAV